MSHQQTNYAARIRKEGYRLTPQRQIILDALCSFGRHATIAEIYARVQEVSPAIDRATVYRTMGFFEALGIVGAAEVDGAAVYEIVSGGAHYHLVCRVCGRIDHLPAYHLADLVSHLEKQHGFVAEIDRLTIPGRCCNCADS